MMEMRFLVRIRGALTAAPRIDEPVMAIPLQNVSIKMTIGASLMRSHPRICAYQAAPTTDRPMHSAIPKFAQAEGVTDSKKAPTLKDSPLPVKSISTSLVSGGHEGAKGGG